MHRWACVAESRLKFYHGPRVSNIVRAGHGKSKQHWRIGVVRRRCRAAFWLTSKVSPAGLAFVPRLMERPFFMRFAAA